jgi:hypothetical protein
MARHPYEYKILVEYINPERESRIPHYSHETDQSELTSMLEKVVTHLPEAMGEGWEVSSHSLTLAKNTLIVTVLLRRPLP